MQRCTDFWTRARFQRAGFARAVPLLALLSCSCSSIRKDAAPGTPQNGGAPESNVDLVAHALETLASDSAEDWRLSPAFRRLAPDGGAPSWSALTGDPTQRGFDDSSWARIKLGD